MTPPEPTPVTGLPWGAVAPDGATTAAGSAIRLGAYCWVEQQLFGMLGSWIQDVPEPDVKLALAEHADHAGWRAQRWYDLIPSAPPGPDALIAAPAGLGDLPTAVRSTVQGRDRTIEKLAVAYRSLVPRLAAAIDAHRGWVSVVNEPSVARLLALVASDLATDWVAGERLLQTLAATPEAAERCRVAQASIDASLIAAGGIVGISSTGSFTAGGGS